MEKAGVGSNFVDESQRTSRSNALSNERRFGLTAPSWHLLSLADGRMISVKDTCPEDIRNTLMRQGGDVCSG